MAKAGFKAMSLVLPVIEWREVQLRAAKSKVTLNTYVRQQLFPEAVIEDTKDNKKTIKVKEDAKAKHNYHTSSN